MYLTSMHNSIRGGTMYTFVEIWNGNICTHVDATVISKTKITLILSTYLMKFEMATHTFVCHCNFLNINYVDAIINIYNEIWDGTMYTFMCMRGFASNSTPHLLMGGHGETVIPACHLPFYRTRGNSDTRSTSVPPTPSHPRKNPRNTSSPSSAAMRSIFIPWINLKLIITFPFIKHYNYVASCENALFSQSILNVLSSASRIKNLLGTSTGTKNEFGHPRLCISASLQSPIFSPKDCKIVRFFL